MEIKISYGDAVCAIPARALGERDAERADLLVLMHLCADPSAAGNIPVLAKRIGCTQKKVLSSIEFWRELGVISVCDTADNTAAAGDPSAAENESGAPGVSASAGNAGIAANNSGSAAGGADTVVKKSGAGHSGIAADNAGAPIGNAASTVAPAPVGEGGASRFEQRPQYSGEELAALTDAHGGELRKLIDTCQGIVGRIFTQAEAAKVVGLYEYLGLDIEHILALFTYCAHRGKRAVGYVEKTAYNLYDEGIDSAAKLEEYIKKKEEKEREEAHLRSLFGLGSRALTAKERQEFAKWLHEWRLPEEVVVRAYELTVENTGKYSLAYMSRVLESWYMAGLCSIEKLDEYERKRLTSVGGASKTGAVRSAHGASGAAQNGADSFDTDRFVELALARSYDALRRSGKKATGDGGSAARSSDSGTQTADHDAKKEKGQ